jgi:predicted nucleic acid-binding protein
VTGVVGVLIIVKQWGTITVVTSLLEQIRISGYWLSDELVMIAARLAGER